jgi:hypothetical protein
MPGWESLSTVAAVHGFFSVTGLVLLLVLTALAALAAWQLRGRQWPEWLDIGEYQLRSRFLEIGIAGVLALLVVSQVVAYGYGARRETLTAAASQAGAEQIKRLTAEAKRQHPAAESANRTLKENSELRVKLTDTENKLAALQRAQIKKHLSEDQTRFLVDALRPYSGQKILIASIRGDDEGSAIAKQLASVFDAAGWDHHGEAGISTQEWDRDPVGIEVVINETDARADKIPPGVAGLVKAIWELGMVYDGTVYLDIDVPSGQALVMVGKKMKK